MCVRNVQCTLYMTRRVDIMWLFHPLRDDLTAYTPRDREPWTRRSTFYESNRGGGEERTSHRRYFSIHVQDNGEECV